jgi:acyl-CoA thioester hydrolase
MFGEIVRFGDLDPQGHVNQAVYSTYFESGRVAIFRNEDLGVGVPGLTFVVVRIEIDFLRELHWPAALEIGSAVAEFGRSSFTMAQAIFRDDICIATARVKMVCIGIETRKPAPLPPALIEQLSKWKYRG